MKALRILLAAACLDRMLVLATPLATNLGRELQRRNLQMDDIFESLDRPTRTLERTTELGSARTTSVDDILGYLTSTPPGSESRTRETSTTSTRSARPASSTASALQPAGGTYSIIGSIPPLPSPTARYTPAAPPSPSSAPVPNPTDLSTLSASASDTTSGGASAKEWKVIGVAVIAFSTVAAILLIAVFFDQWWRFVRDMVGWGGGSGSGSGWGRGGGKVMDGGEELVPDWEKASWEIRLAADRQRYPSFESLSSTGGGGGGSRAPSTESVAVQGTVRGESGPHAAPTVPPAVFQPSTRAEANANPFDDDVGERIRSRRYTDVYAGIAQ